MSIVIVSAQNGLANRWGAIAAGQNEINNLLNGTVTARVATVTGFYQTTESNVPYISPGIFSAEATYQQTNQTIMNYYQSLASNTLIQQINNSYSPEANFGQSQSLILLNNQLLATSSGFQKPTVSYTGTPYAGNTGNAVLSISLENQYGVLLDYLFTEPILLVVSNDAPHGATQFQEAITWQGAPSVNNTSYNWPQGSGANGSMNEINGQGTTLINNGSFETWPSVTAAPTNWTFASGAANVNYLQNSATAFVYTGNLSLEFVGDGATKHDMYQQTNTTLQPTTVYGFNVWAKLSAAATGTFRVSLSSTTGSAGGTPSQNFSGNNNAVSFNLANVGNGTWVALTGWFQTPYIIPSGGLFYEFAFTSALSGANMYIDNVSLAAGQQLYAGGPYANIYSGNVANLIGDYYQAQISNSAGNSTFVRFLDREFNLRTNPPSVGFQMASVTANFIQDSLIA